MRIHGPCDRKQLILKINGRRIKIENKAHIQGEMEPQAVLGYSWKQLVEEKVGDFVDLPLQFLPF